MRVKMNNSKTLFEIVFISVVGISFLLWIGVLFIEGRDSSQFSIFFLRGGNFLADATNVTGYSSLRDPYNNLVNGPGEKGYPPLTYCLMYLMSRITGISGDDYLSIYKDPYFILFFMIFSCILMVLVYQLIKNIKTGNIYIKNLTAMVFCLSAPIIFSLERGNTIILTMLLCMYYIFFYNSDNKFLQEGAYIALAIAAALKMTPAILGILLLYDKKYKEAFRTVLYGLFFTFIPFLFLKGGFSNISLMFSNIQANLEVYTNLEGCGLSATVYTFGKLIFGENYILSSKINFFITMLSYIISVILLLSYRFFEKKWEKMMSIIMILVILPSHSGYYCLLYMFPGILAFLNEEEHGKLDWVYLFCFIIIMWDYICKPQVIFNFNVAIPVVVLLLCISGIKQIYLNLARRRSYGH